MTSSQPANTSSAEGWRLWEGLRPSLQGPYLPTRDTQSGELARIFTGQALERPQGKPLREGAGPLVGLEERRIPCSRKGLRQAVTRASGRWGRPPWGSARSRAGGAEAASAPERGAQGWRTPPCSSLLGHGPWDWAVTRSMSLKAFLLRSRLTVPQVSVGGDGGCVSTCWLSGCPPCPYKQEAVFPKVSQTVLASDRLSFKSRFCPHRVALGKSPLTGGLSVVSLTQVPPRGPCREVLRAQVKHLGWREDTHLQKLTCLRDSPALPRGPGRAQRRLRPGRGVICRVRKRRRLPAPAAPALTPVRDPHRLPSTLGGAVGPRPGPNLGLAVMLLRGVVSSGSPDSRGRSGSDAVSSRAWVECFSISSCEHRKAACLWRTNEAASQPGGQAGSLGGARGQAGLQLKGPRLSNLHGGPTAPSPATRESQAWQWGESGRCPADQGHKTESLLRRLVTSKQTTDSGLLVLTH